MSAVRVWLRSVLRRNGTATIGLVLLVGLGAGVAMATVAAGRRAATSYERMVAFADPPQLLLTFCPPELTEIDEDAMASCFTYEPVEESAAIAELPLVQATSVGAFRGVTVATGSDDEVWPASALVILDPAIHGIDGRQLLVEGRWHDPAAREVVLNEPLADATGLGPGDDVELAFWDDQELGLAGERGKPFAGPRTTARVVGISRGLQDLTTFTRSTEGTADELKLHAGRGVHAATPDAQGFGGVFVEGRGQAGAEELLEAIRSAFPGRPFNVTPAMGEDELAPAREAITYEARGVTALGALFGAAVVVIAGQAVARQARRESVEAPLLHAIGFTRTQVGSAALLRGLSIGVPAAVVAAGTAVALSPLGPVGVGRLAETDPGVRVDGPVLALGALAVIGLTSASAWLPSRRAMAGAGRPAPVGGTARGSLTWLPVPLAVGVRLGRIGRWAGRLPAGTAVAGVALAAGTVAGAVVLTASLDSLQRHPERFGAPWDLSFSPHLGVSSEEAVARVAAHPDVESGAALIGTDAAIGGQTAWVHAFAPLPDLDARIHPPIVDGRAPASVDEIALGKVTMAELDLDIGDQVEAGTAVVGTGSTRLTVVGTAVINDNWEHSPGRGGIVTEEWMARWAPESSASPYVVTLRPGTDVDAFAAAIRDDFGGGVLEPLPQTAVRNVDRIRGVPYVLAAFVTLLAAGAFVHALILSVRRQRPQLAVLRSLGFTSRQVGASVWAYATVLAATSVAVGVPLGIVAGRWGWRVVAGRLGVVTVEVTPVVPLVGLVVGVLAFTTVVAALPAWRAQRVRVGPALRAE